MRPGRGDRRQELQVFDPHIPRKLSVGHDKATELAEMMEEPGVVSTANHVGKREVLVPER
jgi:DNA segregation ATPase FtsK/SpoIIIE, S-DNA-T family